MLTDFLEKLISRSYEYSINSLTTVFRLFWFESFWMIFNFSTLIYEGSKYFTKNTRTSSNIIGNLSIKMDTFWSRIQAHSSFYIRDISGVAILLHIPYRIWALLITNVNLRMTLMAERMTAGFIWERRERHLSTIISAIFGSVISILKSTSIMPTYPHSLHSGRPDNILSIRLLVGKINFSCVISSISESARRVLNNTTVFLLSFKISFIKSNNPFFITNSGFYSYILATVIAAVFWT